MTPDQRERAEAIRAPWVAAILDGIEKRAVEIRRLVDDIHGRVEQLRAAGEPVDYRLLAMQVTTILVAYEAMVAPYKWLGAELVRMHKSDAS